ncbi:30S ribosomal protein S3 [Methanosarcinales archaeon]|nr:MAG: 30S ribosomal protein S3 [Methanosarcinales archaeon]
MGSEKKFVQEGINRAQITEYFIKQLDRAGYGGMTISRTPMGTQITVFAEKPGIIIGKGGRTIRKLTSDVAELFNMDNPQIDVQEVKVPELNAQMMATRLANALERGIYFRKAGHNMLRRIMESGALGCEIITSGKFTGSRSRVQKFVAGNILHAGKPAEELVDDGFATAIKKLGTIGCRVRIIPPGVEIPGQFHTTPRTVEEVSTEPEKPAGVVEILDEAKAETTIEEEIIAESPPETVVETPIETTEPEREEVKADLEEEVVVEVPGEADEETRMRGEVLEHKHKEYDYWHPVSRVHKKEAE